MLLISLLVAVRPVPAAGAPGVVEIPAGSFTQGSGRVPDEPKRTVTLSAYRVDRTEVTIAAFETFAAYAWGRADVWSSEGWAWAQAHRDGAGAQARAAGRAADHPVVAVTWFEADAYCRAQGGALPTEAQWEHAACGDGGRRYPWGDEERAGVAWYANGKHGHVWSVETQRAGVDSASRVAPFGLLHTTGNVWEWTADWYDRASTQGDATDPKGPSDGTWRTLKGGSYSNLASYCTCSHREPARPDRVSLGAGFRCAYPAR